MARKVFISFLGTNNYVETYYTLGDIKSSKPVRFIQESLIDFVCELWSKDDEIIVFCTSESYKKNWLDDGHVGDKVLDVEKKGLGGILDRKNLTPNFTYKTISEGFSEIEVWDIFEEVFKHIQPGDSIYLDVTHAFRSIPIFSTVLMNYAKILKNSNVISVYYGAFEKLGPAYKVKELPLEERIAPIIDLTNVIKLQEITQATNEFLSFGKMGALAMSIEQIDGASSRRERRMNQYIGNLRRALSEIDDSIASCRIKSLTEAKQIKNFFDSYNSLIEKDLLIPAQKKVFEKVYEKMSRFVPEQSNMNVVHAALFAYENKMLQQAYTLGYEIIITFVEEKLSNYKANFINSSTSLSKEVAFRNFTSSILGIKEEDIEKEKFKEPLLSNKEATIEILKFPWIDQLRKEVWLLQNNRNIINHGKGDNKFEDLETQFYQAFESSLKILEIKI